ncbi:hypothetical protein [Rhizobium sp. LjRoot254]|uniref:hypothetical protein n=1 Tax=Rhizobium sp. LjRoot254 TaxID=3342297 RepID=UPI003ECD48AF
MLDEILSVFFSNISRVEKLVALYGPPKQGRRKVNDTDVLRAALVLLHATLEDLLRSVLTWRVPSGTEDVLDAYPFANAQHKRPDKITLGGLSAYRGMTVDALIEKSVVEFLDRWSSFNDLGEVKKALKAAGIAAAAVDAHDFGELAAMIARRHNIVHKADRNEQRGGRGNHPTKSIGLATIDNYLQSVRDLGAFVELHLR